MYTSLFRVQTPEHPTIQGILNPALPHTGHTRTCYAHLLSVTIVIACHVLLEIQKLGTRIGMENLIFNLVLDKCFFGKVFFYSLDSVSTVVKSRNNYNVNLNVTVQPQFEPAL